MDKMDYIETLIKNITYICREKNITPHMLGKESGVGKDIITNMNKGSLPSCDKLAKIADYCDVSVDYLLGRTENPNCTSIKTGDINGNNNSLTDSNNINISNKKSADNISEKFMTVFNNLPFEEQLAVMNVAVEKSKKTHERD